MNYRYDDPEFYVEQATKYALIIDDIALKSVKDQDRYLLSNAARLLRQLGDRIHGEAEISRAQQA